MEREMNGAPQWIFASRDDDGWRWPRASKFPEQGPRENVKYIRADIAESEKLRGMQMAADLCDANFYVNAADMIREAICARAALHEAVVSHAPEVMGHLDDETPQNKASKNDGGRSGGHTTIARKR
jgi:hypothetical protein